MTESKRMPTDKRFQDLTGKRFGRLVVLGWLRQKKNRDSEWRCVCDCGNDTVVTGSGLKTGKTKSCSCLRLENNGGPVIHGMYNTSEYYAWIEANQRCYNKKHKAYPNYGARGITVCERWREGFIPFFEDMGLKPSPDHSVDRIDVNGNYEPSNCRWADRFQQARNRRDNVFLTYNGQTKCLTEWSESSCVSSGTFIKRINAGWSIERALTTPSRSTIARR